jgi:hypothetical protein
MAGRPEITLDKLPELYQDLECPHSIGFSGRQLGLVS